MVTGHDASTSQWCLYRIYKVVRINFNASYWSWFFETFKKKVFSFLMSEFFYPPSQYNYSCKQKNRYKFLGISRFWNFTLWLKFSFSEKATKIWKHLPIFFHVTKYFLKRGCYFKFCGLLKLSEHCNFENIHKVHVFREVQAQTYLQPH